MLTVPPRRRVPASDAPSQMSSSTTVRASGRLPMSSLLATTARLGSMRASVPANSFATQTAPGVTATLTGPSFRPTGTVAVTTPRLRSTRETVPSSGLAIQTAP